MKFKILMTTGSEVKISGDSQKDQVVYYGEPPATGMWHVSITEFEDFMSHALEPHSFGDSVEEFVFGFEIAELEEWGPWFKATRNLVSYRPKYKQLLSVGQIEWKDVKGLSIDAQMLQLFDALLASIDRIGKLQRKPKDFDIAKFGQIVRMTLANCTAEVVST